MSKKLHAIPARDPVSGGELYVSELSNDDSGIRIKGKFSLNRYARLDADQSQFLEAFLRCRGTISAVERELKISYPTVKARLDQLLGALDLQPIDDKKSDGAKGPRLSKESAQDILDKLERGEISPDEAKKAMRSKE